MENKGGIENIQNEIKYVDEIKKSNASTTKELFENNFLNLRKRGRKFNLTKKNIDNLNQISNSKTQFNLDDNSYTKDAPIIQNFFNNNDKSGYLFQLLLNIINNNSYLDLNLIKFIIVQCNNFYEPLAYEIKNGDEKKAIEKLEHFFTTHIITNLIEIMYAYKENEIIIINLCSLLQNLTYQSTFFTKSITLSSYNIQKIFSCLDTSNENILVSLLQVFYNCYLDDEFNFCKGCNIGIFILESLNKYYKTRRNEVKNEYLINLLEFLRLMLNDNTFEFYKSYVETLNNNINFMIQLCRDCIDENSKKLTHECLELLLHCVEEDTIKIKCLYEITETFIPHLKFELNDSFIIIKTLEILALFTYLLKVNDFVNNELIDEIDRLLANLVSGNIQNYNLKEYSVNHIVKNLSTILINITTTSKKFSKYITNESSIIDSLVMVMKKYQLDTNTNKDLYEFYKEFIGNKEQCMCLILSNFIEIGILNPLNQCLLNKNKEVVILVLDISLELLNKCNQFIGGQADEINVVQIHLYKKGINDKLNVIIGPDFGDSACSELARTIQESYFNKL